MLRALLKFAKQKPSLFGRDPEITDDGANHLKLFDVSKKEFKLMRILWRHINDNVAAVDELNMSVMRLRLRYEDEPVTSQNALKRKRTDPDGAKNLKTREKDKFETIYILEQHELPSQRLKLVSEKTIANSEFRKKFGQMLYLENLKKSDYGKKGGTGNPEPCPICQTELGHSWAVMQVGPIGLAHFHAVQLSFHVFSYSVVIATASIV